MRCHWDEEDVWFSFEVDAEGWVTRRIELEGPELGGPAARRSDWAGVRLAVMAGLPRTKVSRHPELAEVLVATGDARISCTGLSEAPLWTDAPVDRGRDWAGRLLELTRSELVARRTPPLRSEDPGVPAYGELTRPFRPLNRRAGVR